MARSDADVAILGGGCAGLSLGYRLAQGGGLRVHILEPRTLYRDDRAWSFWRTRPDPFQDLVRARWPQWSVSLPGRPPIHRRSRPLTYDSLAAAPFYTRCCQTLAAAPAATLSLGTTAVGATPLPDGRVRVETDQGSVTARYVIDTRPPRRRPGFGQYFAGREIATSAPMFDRHCATLMAFRGPFRHAVEFVYVLPFAADRALVELTWFAATPPRPGQLDQRLGAEIDRLTNGYGGETIRREAGVIPMEPIFAEHRPGMVAAGLGGGAARPSTGYAFQRIQAWADACAQALRSDGPPIGALPDPAPLRAMDTLFLRVLKRDLSRGPALYTSLFRHAAPGRLERFLSGSAAWTDKAAMARALPKAPFLAEAARAAAFL
ncbi:MAG: lycopene cyclase family protein [Rhodothalassiaceae bacterium]